MDVRDKLELLGRAAQFEYDECNGQGATVGLAGGRNTYGSPAAPPDRPDMLADGRGLFAPTETDRPTGRDVFPYISHITVPGCGRRSILKVLQTSACQNDCRYCAFRSGRDFRRTGFTPDELAKAFDLMYRSGAVQGMFLSSGVAGTNRSMDEMLATVELVRGRYDFRGYVHLKILPGVEAAQIARAVELADRVSVNLEAPNARRLEILAPQKQMAQLVGPLRAAAQVIQEHSQWADHDRDRRRPRRMGPLMGLRNSGLAGWTQLGMTTQFVVGPAGESDKELLATAESLYRQVGLARAYYSAFNPVADTPLESIPPTDPRREYRLYQADFLLRYYRFSAEELPFDPVGRLPERLDPKAAWAQKHPERFPVEVNKAPVAELMRVPGIGPVSAQAIAEGRRKGTIRGLGDLRRLGARAHEAAPYVLLAGKRPPYQPPLPL